MNARSSARSVERGAPLLRAESKEDGFIDDAAVAEMLDDNALEKLWRDTPVPYSLGIDDNDRATRADAKTGRFAALHAAGSE